MPSLPFVVPSFDDPYPSGKWSKITDFKYETGLHLYRAIEAVRTRHGDDADYIVARDYTVSFNLDGKKRKITVPRGMLTDLASVPRVAQSMIGRVGPHLEASIVHDFLYIAWQDLAGHGAREKDRTFADNVLLTALVEAKVDLIVREAMFKAVRIAGWPVYKERDEPRYVELPSEV